MLEMKNVYDHKDFVKPLEKDDQAMQLNHSDFYDIPQGISASKEDVRIAKFKRGSISTMTNVTSSRSFY